ncbi:MAG: hypothetical protein IJJ50_08600 [Lachnospiraceae bacterium]|nr:hypothetical protein [Lachnospiraceae bacterium]
MRDKAKADRIRRRAVRDLIAAAVLIVVILAYFIPGVTAGVQDLALARRKNSYKTEAVRFASESAHLAERIRMVRSFDSGQIDFVELQAGQKMDRETAEKTALEEAGKLLDFDVAEEYRKILAYYRDVIGSGSWYADSAVGMTVSPVLREPFIVWVSSFTFEDGFDLFVLLDESSGKILSLGINTWDAAALSGWDWSGEAPAFAAGLADYYGMTGNGGDCYMEIPFIFAAEVYTGEDTLRIPVTITDSSFEVNPLEIENFLSNYGLSPWILDENGAEEMPEEELPEAEMKAVENVQKEDSADKDKKG